MIFTLVAAGLGLIVSLLFRARPQVMIFAILVLYMFIPPHAIGSSVPTLYHPALLLLAAFALVTVLSAPHAVYRALNQSIGLLFLAILLLLYMSAVKWGVGEGSELLSWAIPLVIAPFVIFIATKATIENDSAKLRFLIAGVALMNLSQVALAWTQFLTGDVIFWGADFARQWWWRDENREITQAVGTFGQHIPLSVFLALSLPFATLVKSRILWFILIAGSLSTVVATSARTGIVLIGISVLYTILREFHSGKIGRVATVFFLLLPLAAVVTALIRSDFAARLFQRVEDDRGSNDLRITAMDWFWDNFDQFLFVPSDVRTGREVLGSSLENGFFIFATNFSTVAALLLITLYVGLIVSLVRSRGTYRFAAVVVVLLYLASTFIYSSFGVEFRSEILLVWVIGAIGMIEFPGEARGSRMRAASERRLE